MFPCRSLSLPDYELSSMKTIIKLGSTVENLYMAGNKIRVIPEEVFRHLPCLKWLDMRDNYLITLPDSMAHHPTLEVVLLDNNLFSELPPLLGTLPRLRMIGLRGNILNCPRGAKIL